MWGFGATQLRLRDSSEVSPVAYEDSAAINNSS